MEKEKRSKRIKHPSASNLIKYNFKIIHYKKIYIWVFLTPTMEKLIRSLASSLLVGLFLVFAKIFIGTYPL